MQNQALSTIASFQCQSAPKLGSLSPLTKAVSLNISVLKRITISLDPSNSQWAICRKVSTNKQVSFKFNTKRNVSEILQVVRDELESFHYTQQHTSTSTRTSTAYNTGRFYNIEEVKLDIFPIPEAKSIYLFLERIVYSENVTKDSKWFCQARNGPKLLTLRAYHFFSCSLIISKGCNKKQCDGKSLPRNTDPAYFS